MALSVVHLACVRIFKGLRLQRCDAADLADEVAVCSTGDRAGAVDQLIVPSRSLETVGTQDSSGTHSLDFPVLIVPARIWEIGSRAWQMAV